MSTTSPTVVTLADDQKDSVSYIGKDNTKRFLMFSTLTLVLFYIPHFACLWITGFGSGINNKRNSFFGSRLKRMIGENQGKISDMNFIVMFTAFILSVTLISIFPSMGRKRMGFVMLPVIFFSGGFCSLIFMANQIFIPFAKTSILYGWLFETLYLYLMLFNGAISAFSLVVIDHRKPDKELGIFVSLLLLVVELVYLHYFVSASSMTAVGYFVIGLVQSWISMYYCHDLKMMVKRRGDFYLCNDWILGFVHLLTDFTFRFWRDLFLIKKPTGQSGLGDIGAKALQLSAAVDETLEVKDDRELDRPVGDYKDKSRSESPDSVRQQFEASDKDDSPTVKH